MAMNLHNGDAILECDCSDPIVFGHHCYSTGYWEGIRIAQALTHAASNLQRLTRNPGKPHTNHPKRHHNQLKTLPVRTRALYEPLDPLWASPPRRVGGEKLLYSRGRPNHLTHRTEPYMRFEEILPHLRQGGQARRSYWQDTTIHGTWIQIIIFPGAAEVHPQIMSWNPHTQSTHWSKTTQRP